MNEEPPKKRTRTEYKQEAKTSYEPSLTDALNADVVNLLQRAGDRINPGRPEATRRQIDWLMRIPKPLWAPVLLSFLRIGDRARFARSHKGARTWIFGLYGHSTHEAVWSEPEVRFLLESASDPNKVKAMAEGELLQPMVAGLRDLRATGPITTDLCKAVCTTMQRLSLHVDQSPAIDLVQAVASVDWPALRHLRLSTGPTTAKANPITAYNPIRQRLAPLAGQLQSLDLLDLMMPLSPTDMHTFATPHSLWAELQELDMPMDMTLVGWARLARTFPKLTRLVIRGRLGMDLAADQKTRSMMVMDDRFFASVAKRWPRMRHFEWHIDNPRPQQNAMTGTPAGWRSLARGWPELRVFRFTLHQWDKWTIHEDALVECLVGWPHVQHLHISCHSSMTKRVLQTMNNACRHLRTASLAIDHRVYIGIKTSHDATGEDLVAFIKAHPDLEAVPQGIVGPAHRLFGPWMDTIVQALADHCLRLKEAAEGGYADWIHETLEEKSLARWIHGCRDIVRVGFNNVWTLSDQLFEALADAPPRVAPAYWTPTPRVLETLILNVWESCSLSGASLQMLATSCPRLKRFELDHPNVNKGEPEVALVGTLALSMNDIRQFVQRCPHLRTCRLFAIDEGDMDVVSDDATEWFSHPLSTPVDPVDLDTLLSMPRPEFKQRGTHIAFSFLRWTDANSPLVESVLSKFPGAIKHAGRRIWVIHNIGVTDATAVVEEEDV